MFRAHERVGDFEIIRLLGKGGMGEVYEAQQLSPPRRVALKVLAPWLADSDEALERFWREAAVPAQLDHPGIVRIISCGKTDDGRAYYTMQLIRGVSLAQLMRGTATMPQPETVSQPVTAPQVPPRPETPAPGARTPTPEESALHLVQEYRLPLVQEYRTDRYRVTARLGAHAARALADAHRRGFLHRDIKPSNIMVDGHGHLYLLDFGLTRLLDPGGSSTRPGVVLGTPWYMSPEQARGQPLDRRSDLYSLGVTLYQLASGGKGPFTAPTDESEAVLAQVRAGEHVPLRKLAPEVPADLAQIVSRAIQRNPRRRYQTAEDLAADLDAFLGKAPATQPLRPARPAHRPMWLAGGIVVVVAAVLAAIGLTGGLGGPSEQNPGGAPAMPGLPLAAKGPASNPAERSEVPYPDLLRNRPDNFALSLFSRDFEPLWQRRLVGLGKYHRTDFQLILSSPSDQEPTLLALDDDPARRWFEFAVELNAARQGPGKERLGVFFGWRSNAGRFFFVEVDENAAPGYPTGRAMVGVIRIVRGQGAEGSQLHTAALPGDRGPLPLAAQEKWHRVIVRAVDHTVTVTVDGKARVFERDQLSHQGEGAAPDPRGALGIWVWNGYFGAFRNATVTALHSIRDNK